MGNVIYDPKLYLLFVAAYVVGFVDTEDPTACNEAWDHVADLAFWCSLALAVALFVAHGFAEGIAGLLGAWAASVIGLRRGILAERNTLWETILWTMPLQLIKASATVAGAGVSRATPVTATAAMPAPVRPRRASNVRPIDWQLPALASLLPGRGRRLTIMGIAMDMAACLLVVSALSLLVR